jgi:hypothetical protein
MFAYIDTYAQIHIIPDCTQVKFHFDVRILTHSFALLFIFCPNDLVSARFQAQTQARLVLNSEGNSTR